MKSASEVLAKYDIGVRHYHNDSPYVKKCDALMAMEEYANQSEGQVDAEVDVKTAESLIQFLEDYSRDDLVILIHKIGISEICKEFRE